MIRGGGYFFLRMGTCHSQHNEFSGIISTFGRGVVAVRFEWDLVGPAIKQAIRKRKKDYTELSSKDNTRRIYSANSFWGD